MVVRKNFVISIIFIGGIIFLFLPEYSRLQQLRHTQETIERKIKSLKKQNSLLKKEIEELEHNPVYIEKVIRKKLRVAKKGEIIYKLDT